MRTYSREEFEKIVQESKTIREVLIKLGLHPAGGNYQTFHRTVKLWNVDTSHFVTARNGSYVGQSVDSTQKPLYLYLENLLEISSSRLKKRLIKEGYFTNCCCACHLTTWMGQSIPLELHHIDGNHSNNALENLTMLCPNCHAQTKSHRVRKDGLSKTKRYRANHIKVCPLCNKPIGPIPLTNPCSRRSGERAKV